MARLQLFEYAVLLHPEMDSEGKQVNPEEDTIMLIEPTRALAVNAHSLAFKIARKIPKENENDFDRIEIITQDF